MASAWLDPFSAKITVSQGIVIDPRKHPNQATVFALVMWMASNG